MSKFLDKKQFSEDKLTESRKDELTKFAVEISNNLSRNHNIKIEEYNYTTKMGNK